MQALWSGTTQIVGNAGFKGAPTGGQVEPRLRRPRRLTAAKASRWSATRFLLDRATRGPSVTRVLADDPSRQRPRSIRRDIDQGRVPGGRRPHPDRRWGRQPGFLTAAAERRRLTSRSTWEEVVAYAVALPRSRTRPLRDPVAQGRGQAHGPAPHGGRRRTRDQVLGADKVALVGGDDPAYYTTPHYDGYNYVLVRLELAGRRVFELIGDAWHIAATAKSASVTHPAERMAGCRTTTSTRACPPASGRTSWPGSGAGEPASRPERRVSHHGLDRPPRSSCAPPNLPPQVWSWDSGCGWGPIACALAGTGATVLATDVNERALELSALNAARLGVTVHMSLPTTYRPTSGSTRSGPTPDPHRQTGTARPAAEVAPPAHARRRGQARREQEPRCRLAPAVARRPGLADRAHRQRKGIPNPRVQRPA